jgi:fungal nitric oxide reductase
MRHPQQLAELKANPALAPAFVNELCRYHTGSALAMKRVAKVDIELGGKVNILLTSSGTISKMI